MFFDEASIASRLHHGNIVQVLDYGTVDGSEFIAMELVDGLDANSAFRMGEERGESLPAAVALYVIAETAYALEYAHAAGVNHDDVTGVVHRDVSPHNILLSWDGDVKLSDFGIAFAETKSERTRTGVIKGKFSFMAPEQAAGKRVDGAADVYALGVTLRLLLGAGTEVDRDASGVALYLDEVHEDLAVQTLLKSMLSLDPGSRPSAGDVAKEAGAFAASVMQGAGRGELKAWLSRVRRERQASALDDLMGLVLVPTGDGRAFTAVRVQGDVNEEVSGEGPTTPFAGESRPESRSERVGVAQPKVKRHSGWTAVSVMAVIGLATVVYLYWGGRGEIHPRPAESSVAVVPSVSFLRMPQRRIPQSLSCLWNLTRPWTSLSVSVSRPARRTRRSSTAARAEPRQPIVAMEVMEAPTTLDFGYIRVPRAAGAGRGASARRWSIDGVYAARDSGTSWSPSTTHSEFRIWRNRVLKSAASGPGA